MVLISVLLGSTSVFAMSAGSLEVDAGSDMTACEGVLIQFNEARIIWPNPLDPEKTYTWSWDFDDTRDENHDGIKDNDAESMMQYSECVYLFFGEYTVTVTVSDGVDTAKDTLVVTVTANQPPQIDAPDTLSGYVGEEVEFDLSATDDSDLAHYLHWHWDFGDGNIHFGMSTVNHTFSLIGSYTVTVTVTDTELASSECNILVVVQEKPGESGKVYEVDEGGLVQEDKEVREDGYVAYKITVPGDNTLKVTVTANQSLQRPVSLLVFDSELDFLDYELGIGDTWNETHSVVETDYIQSMEVLVDEECSFYIVVDNGYQITDGDDGGMSSVSVNVQIEGLRKGTSNGGDDDSPGLGWATTLLALAIVAMIAIRSRDGHRYRR